MSKNLTELRAERDEREAAAARASREAQTRYYRRYYIKRQLPAARLKVEFLEREAARLGVTV